MLRQKLENYKLPTILAWDLHWYTVELSLGAVNSSVDYSERSSIDV
jgi:hypothetical protein